MIVEEVDAAIALERFTRARQLLEEASSEAAGEPAARWSLALRRARLEQDDPSVPVDETLLRLRALTVDPMAVEAELPQAHALLVRGWAIKRSRAMVEEALARAREAVGAHPRVAIEEGRAMMRFDERERARRCFLEAIEGSTSEGSTMVADEARLALADALYVLGDFDGAIGTLEGIVDPTVQVPALRVRASCLAARRDHAAEADAWRAALERRPDGDRAQADRVALALALAASDRRADALEELGRAWRADPESGQGRYARERMSHLERHLEGGRSARLAAFPTTAQKWNYCGPAVLELCLRYLSIELTQDEIASVVKRERGTPMYEIATFLSAHAIEARRIEATQERLMAALDLGLPVIVQEEYSTTSHVAVLTGYDEALGTFMAQDPATHRPIVKSFEFTQLSGDLYGNGAIIVLGREGEALEARRRACDEVGLHDAPHLGILDDADRMRPSAAGGGREHATTSEVLRRCDEAIALAPRFKLAWHRKVAAGQRRYRETGRTEDRDRMLADLRHVRTTFASDEWPHQLHAEWLMTLRLWDEAFVEHLEASRRDPGDSNNRADMGECMWLSGDLARAERYLLEALALDPTHVRAAENLAAVYARELVERRRGQSSADRPLESALSPARVIEGIERETDELIERAAHLSHYVCAEHAWNTFNHEVAGELAALGGDFQASAEAFGRARERDPDRSWARLGHALALRELGRLEEACEALDPLTSSPRSPLRVFTLLAEVRERLSDAAGAAEVLTGALRAGVAPDTLAAALYRLYRRSEGGEAAAARLRELAEERAGDGALARAVGGVLDDEGQRGHAIALMRRVVEATPKDVDSVWRLARLLNDDAMTRQESEALLGRVIALAPSFAGSRIRMAFSLMERDPDRAIALLDELGETEDSFVLETRSAVLARMGRGAEAARTLERALAAYGDPDRGLIRMTDWHVDARRYDRALTLARLLPERVRSPEADRAWLSALRLGGAMREAEPRLRELSAGGVPSHLAWDAYWGIRSIDSALAAEAASCVAAQQKGQQAIIWRLRAAGARAKGGDDAELRALEAELDESAESFAQLAYCYEHLHRYEEANRAAERAYALDDTHLEALSAMEGVWVRRGDLAAAIACARRLIELHPYEHVGPERLAMLLAQSLEVEEALACSHRAVDAAPFCHNAHWARSAALFAADELEGAERHARRVLALEEADAEDDANGALMLLHALEGRADALERCLASTYRQRPDVFPAFDAKLRALARSRG